MARLCRLALSGLAGPSEPIMMHTAGRLRSHSGLRVNYRIIITVIDSSIRDCRPLIPQGACYPLCLSASRCLSLFLSLSFVGVPSFLSSSCSHPLSFSPIPSSLVVSPPLLPPLVPSLFLVSSFSSTPPLPLPSGLASSIPPRIHLIFPFSCPFVLNPSILIIFSFLFLDSPLLLSHRHCLEALQRPPWVLKSHRYLVDWTI